MYTFTWCLARLPRFHKIHKTPSLDIQWFLMLGNLPALVSFLINNCFAPHGFWFLSSMHTLRPAALRSNGISSRKAAAKSEDSRLQEGNDLRKPWAAPWASGNFWPLDLSQNWLKFWKGYKRSERRKGKKSSFNWLQSQLLWVSDTCLRQSLLTEVVATAKIISRLAGKAMISPNFNRLASLGHTELKIVSSSMCFLETCSKFSFKNPRPLKRSHETNQTNIAQIQARWPTTQSKNSLCETKRGGSLATCAT